MSRTSSTPLSLTPWSTLEKDKEPLTPKHLPTTDTGDNTRIELDNSQLQYKKIYQGRRFDKRYQDVKTGSITINGAKLEDIMKKKKDQEDKNLKKEECQDNTAIY